MGVLVMQPLPAADFAFDSPEKLEAGFLHKIPSHIAIILGPIPYLNGVWALCWIHHVLGYGVMLANNLNWASFQILNTTHTHNDNQTRMHGRAYRPVAKKHQIHEMICYGKAN